MPKNGEVNNKFGVYRTLCCGTEMVIPEGEAFPDCPRHIHLTTEWKLVVNDRIPKASETTPKKKRGAA
jgi:hypothetical protein